MKRFALIALLTCLAAPVFAHSPLRETTPAAGAELTTAPEVVTMTFSRSMRLTRVNWSVDDQSGTLDLSEYKSFATDFALPFSAETAGTYVIEWRGLGDDGHPQNGSFSFVVQQ